MGGGGIVGKAVGAVSGLVKTAVNVSSLGLVKKKAVGSILDNVFGGAFKDAQNIFQPQPAAAQGGPKEKPAQKSEKAPKPGDAAIQKAKKKQSMLAALSSGKAGNILTSGQGLTTAASTTKKTLLGQ